MAGLQDLLAGQANLQQNAQANIPMTLNNGNPGGINNTPLPPVDGSQPIENSSFHYPWLQPTSHMDAIQQMLNGGQQALPPVMQQPIQQQGWTNNITPIQAQAPPVVPSAVAPPTYGNIMPQPAGPVMPQQYRGGNPFEQRQIRAMF